MQLKSTVINKLGQKEDIIYTDINSENDLQDRNIRGCRAYCFYNNQLVIVYSDSKGFWSLPGGGREKGETVSEAVTREVKEETNMRVLKQELIGIQEVISSGKTNYYSTSVCIVEPYGNFTLDPDGEITKMKLIEPVEFIQYSHFPLGKILDRMMERAFELKEKMELK